MLNDNDIKKIVDFFSKEYNNSYITAQITEINHLLMNELYELTIDTSKSQRILIIRNSMDRIIYKYEK